LQDFGDSDFHGSPPSPSGVRFSSRSTLRASSGSRANHEALRRNSRCGIVGIPEKTPPASRRAPRTIPACPVAIAPPPLSTSPDTPPPPPTLPHPPHPAHPA